MAYKFIQVIGTQRSGTNLLRVILNQFPEISAPHPPHLLKNFYPFLKYYGDLTVESNFHNLVKDVIEWIRLNPVSWDIEFELEDVVNLCQSNTLLDVFRAINLLKAKSERAVYWCCKSTFNLNYYEEFEKTGFEPIYIHLVRDGRDVALSFKKAPVGDKHIYQLANNWKNDQIKVDKIKNVIPADRFLTIKYEDLIHHPEEVVKHISSKLAIPYNSEFLKYYKSEESKHTAEAGEMWSNLTRPILSNNSKKYLTDLSDQDLVLFDRVAADILERYNYEPFSNSREPFKEEEVSEFNKENEMLIDQTILNSNSPILRKRNEQIAIFKKFSQVV